MGSYDGTIQLYNNTNDYNNNFLNLEGPSDVEFLTFHPNSNGTTLLAGSYDGTVWLFHLSSESYKCLQVFVGHNNEVIAGTFATNGKFVLSAGVDCTVKMWNPKTGICKHTFNVSTNNTSSRLTCMDVWNDLILVGCEDGTASLLHVKNKKILCVLPHATNTIQHDNGDNGEAVMMSIEAVGFLHHESFKWCATAASDGIVKIWDLSIIGVINKLKNTIIMQHHWFCNIHFIRLFCKLNFYCFILVIVMV